MKNETTQKEIEKVNPKMNERLIKLQKQRQNAIIKHIAKIEWFDDSIINQQNKINNIKNK